MAHVKMPSTEETSPTIACPAPLDRSIDKPTACSSRQSEQLSTQRSPPSPRRCVSESETALPKPELLSPPPPSSESAPSLPASRSSSCGSAYASGGEQYTATSRFSTSRRPLSSYGGSFQNTLSPAPPDQSEPRRLAKRRSWLPGLPNLTSGGRKSNSHEEKYKTWIVGPGSEVEFDASPLRDAWPIPELWDPEGDTFVYLFPRSTGKPPSFRVDSSIFSSSEALTESAHGGIYSQEDNVAPERSCHDRKSSSPESTPQSPGSSPVTSSASGASDSSRPSRASTAFSETTRKEIHLYLTEVAQAHHPGQSSILDSSEDLEELVSMRNLFAFLQGQALIGTSKHRNILSIFLRVGTLLENLKFSNLDGSTFGEIPTERFNRYVEEFGLADVRKSPEKTIEGLILGERLRSVKLYNECFVHGVGNFDSLMKLDSPQYGLISDATRKRMERASMDMSGRLENVRRKLQDFEFPSLWAGIASSHSVNESKNIRFKAWRAAFLSTRKHYLGHLKKTYGSWPPKASSKRNGFEENGLNRVVLQQVYQDLADVYDLMVDRNSLTTRAGLLPSQSKTAATPGSEDSVIRALRGVLGEYDRSSPPVLPPIPFDVPLLPSLTATRKESSAKDAKKDSKEKNKRLKDDAILVILQKVHNIDAIQQSPFLEAFRAFEQKEAHGKSVNDLCDLRIGQWIFIYTVLQALPMITVDAPGVQWKRGVEYFLCEPPKGSVPWSKEDPGLRMNWYEIAGGSGFVSLPSDIVDYSIEGTYRRSHCWEAAAKWSEDVVDPSNINQPADAGVHPSAPGSPATSARLLSPNRSITPQHRLSVVNLGLEALAVPSGVSPDGTTPARPVSTFNPNLSFETIIGSVETGNNDRNRRRSKVSA